MEKNSRPPRLAQSRRITLLAYLLALITLSAFLAGCSGSDKAPLTPAPPHTLRIISSLPTKGETASQSKQISQAIDLAISQRASQAGASAWHIEHVALEGGSDESGEWSGQRERANAQLAADDPAVIAYIGPYNSGAAAISLPITNRAGLLQCSPSATWPGLTQAGWDPDEPDRYYPTGARNFVRLMPPDSEQAYAAARWASQLGIHKMAILEDGSSYSDGLGASFAGFAATFGISAGETIRVNPANPGNLPATLSNYEAVFYAPSTVANAIAVAQALQTAHIKLFASDTALDPRFADNVGAGASNWYIVSNSATPQYSSPRGARFQEAFQSHYNTSPGQFAANAYDLTNLVLEAISSGAGSNRAEITRFVTGTRNYQGVMGSVSFDGAGDPVTWRMTGYRWSDGRFGADRMIVNEP